MKTHEWFVCLNYGSLELLIPHSVITDTFSSSQKNTGLKNHYIDGMLKQDLPKENARSSKLLVQSKTLCFITTSASVSIRQVPLKNFFMPEGTLKEPLMKRGIIAFSFENSTMRLLVDIDSFIEYGGRL